MIPLPYWPQIKLGLIVAALAVTFGSGWKVRDWRCDAAASELQVRTLEAEANRLRTRIKTASDASEEDRKRAEADAKRIAELEQQIAATPHNPKSCLDRGTAKRIREVQ